MHNNDPATPPPVHYELEVLADTLFTPLCFNQRGCDAFDDCNVEMTPDEADVTCRKCLAALGYIVEVEHLGEGRIAA